MSLKSVAQIGVDRAKSWCERIKVLFSKVDVITRNDIFVYIYYIKTECKNLVKYLDVLLCNANKNIKNPEVSQNNFFFSEKN